MKQKIGSILVGVSIVVTVAVIAGFFLLNNLAGNNPTVSVANASSLRFSYDYRTNHGWPVTEVFSGKYIGTSELLVRIDVLGGSAGNWSYVLDTGLQRSLNRTDDGVWVTSSNYTFDWNHWGPRWTRMVNNLKNWSGTGDYSYNSSRGNPLLIYNIEVNPDLPDSLFQHSSVMPALGFQVTQTNQNGKVRKGSG